RRPLLPAARAPERKGGPRERALGPGVLGLRPRALGELQRSPRIRDLGGHPLLRAARRRRDRAAAETPRSAPTVPRSRVSLPAARLRGGGTRSDRGSARRQSAHDVARLRARRHRSSGLLVVEPARGVRSTLIAG